MSYANLPGLPASSEQHLSQLTDHAERSLEILTGLGVEHAEVAVSQGSQLEVSVRDGEIELLKEAKSTGLSVRVMWEDRVATSATTDLRPEFLEAFFARVKDMAAISEPDALAVPPDPSEMAQTLAALDLFDPKTLELDADFGLAQAMACEKAALGADERITASEGASFSRGVGHTVLGTTGGFMGHSAGTSQYLAAHVVADDEGGKKRNGHYWTGGRFVGDIDGAAAVGAEAARRAVACLGSAKMKTGVYPVVFHREAAAGIVRLLASCVLGGAVYRNQSYLEGRLGSRVASDLVFIEDNPLIPRGPGSRAFDAEGRAARTNAVVDGGMLETYLLDSYSARKLGMSPTGSAGGAGGIPHSTTSNFRMRAGTHEPHALLEGIAEGLFVTSMIGFGFEPVSGNFSRGAQGFVIRNGALAEPVSEITISRNLDELLQGIDAVANNPDLRTATSAPRFRVDSMTVSGG